MGRRGGREDAGVAQGLRAFGDLLSLEKKVGKETFNKSFWVL